jgi:hypothetical protein
LRGGGAGEKKIKKNVNIKKEEEERWKKYFKWIG